MAWMVILKVHTLLPGTKQRLHAGGTDDILIVLFVDCDRESFIARDFSMVAPMGPLRQTVGSQDEGPYLS